MSRMEYGRFFFYYANTIGATKTTNTGEASLADILFQKLFSIKKTLIFEHFKPKTSKTAFFDKMPRNSPKQPKSPKSVSPSQICQKDPSWDPSQKKGPRRPPQKGPLLGPQKWTPGPQTPPKKLIFEGVLGGGPPPKTTLCGHFLKKCPAMVKTEAFFFDP